ncbi:MAG: type I restriction enzyme HsdR N-terminal domain-containing protein [Chloroflexota bacterium]|nr:type I restriction enzyme HsdR N-terminal domain-containing protein [Chloroflexota bacterium]MDE2895382.1 type I restriction enzyme HsdR N-terminal domain-containing protein [Chloroflexota bacterium]
MVLEDLHELVETLQRRIAEHRPALQQSEALTRSALIDPLLRGLGWDTGDPNQVVPEYRSAAGSADYALFGTSNKPQIIIEAKRLGAQLDFKVRQQVTGYCQEEGIPYAAITDGRYWELYDVFKPAAMKDSIVTMLDLGDAPPETSLKALALWRPNVGEGNTSIGATPLLETPQVPPPISQPANVADQPFGDGWLPIADYAPPIRSNIKPSAVRFPGGSAVAVKHWSEVVRAIVARLQDQGRLTENHLPIVSTQPTRYVLSSEPRHPSGKPIRKHVRIGAMYFDREWNGDQHVLNARLIIRTAGLDPADFAVRLQ